MDGQALHLQNGTKLLLSQRKPEFSCFAKQGESSKWAANETQMRLSDGFSSMEKAMNICFFYVLEKGVELLAKGGSKV